MLVSYILGFIVIIAYIAYIIIKDKAIPQSISATVYSLDTKHKWLFTMAMAATAFLILTQLLKVMEHSEFQFLSFLTVIGMLGVGSDPLIHGEKNIIHYVSAVVMGISAQAITFITMPSIMLLWFPYIVLTLLKEDGSKNMFYGEITMMVELFVCGIAAQ